MASLIPSWMQGAHWRRYSIIQFYSLITERLKSGHRGSHIRPPRCVGMVGIFSRLTSTRAGLRSQASSDEREGTPSGKDSPATLADNHGVEPTEEFKPVEHPLEPPDKDQPVRCPPPEPSILHDGRIWKERLEASVRRRAEFPVIRESATQSQMLHRRRHTFSSEQSITPSFSCPEHSLLKLLDECNEQLKS